MAENSSSSVITSWPTDCPFAEVGCTSSLSTSTEYSLHLAQHTEQHLQMVVDLHKETKIISPLEKLNAVMSEIAFLEGTLESLGVRQLPSLECIKTQMKQPDVTISSLGDRCTFRMPGFMQLRDSSKKWKSPPFSLRDTYQLQLVVHPNGTGSGLGTHISVFLVLGFGDQFELPISLPRHLGVRVELLVETDGSVSDNGEDDSESESLNGLSDHSYEFTWRPKSAKTTSGNAPHKTFNIQASQQPNTKEKQLDDGEARRRVSKILPPWCQPPTTDTAIDSTKAATTNIPGQFPLTVESKSKQGITADHLTKRQRKTGVSREMKSQEDGVNLFSAEKFATRGQVDDLVREFNSLVFQITICLV